MKILGLRVLTNKKYYEKLDESLVSGYFSAVSGIDGKKKVFLEPVTYNCEQATIKDCCFLGACQEGSCGVYINTKNPIKLEP